MLEWYLPERGATPAEPLHAELVDDVARAAEQARRRAENLGVARFSFAQSDLA